MKKIVLVLMLLLFLVFYFQDDSDVLGDSIAVGVKIYTFAIDITEINVFNLLSTSADVSWNTTGNPSVCVFSFGETESYELGSFSETIESESHIAEVSNLTLDTLYYYKIECLTVNTQYQGYGEEGVLTFETLSSSPVSPPDQIIDITGVSVDTEDDSAEISWNTSISSTCGIQLGKTSSLEVGTFNESSSSIIHDMEIGDLSSDTKYYYKIYCEASGGEYGETNVMEFFTEEESSGGDDKEKDKKTVKDIANYIYFSADSPSIEEDVAVPTVEFLEKEEDLTSAKTEFIPSASLDKIIKKSFGFKDYFRIDIVLVLCVFLIILIIDVAKLSKSWNVILFIFAYVLNFISSVITINIIFSLEYTFVFI